MKISIIGKGHMANALAVCLEKMGNTIVSLDCDVCWIAIDTPVNKDGQGNVESIFKAVKDAKLQLKKGTLVIVSSQIPVGTSKQIVKMLGKNFDYAYMPEHMKIGTGVEDFDNLKEVVMGVDSEDCKDKLSDILKGKKVVFVSVATAEMIKHALNAFLATSLSFIYDIADVCEVVGADVTDVARALRADDRIGQKAYLDASVGFSGGHLERDLGYLEKVAYYKGVSVPVIRAVMEKNEKRRKIILDKLGNVKGEKIIFWGITYKPGVPPSEDSLPAKLMRDLKGMDAKVVFCDPYFEDIDLYTPAYMARDCIAVICITPWEDLKKIHFREMARLMKKPKIFFDARNYFKKFENEMKAVGIKYIGVGR